MLLLIVLPGALLYPGLSFPLFEPDEGRYAEIPREMLARGDWVVPYLQGQPYLDKPPLFYWLVMIAFRTLGISDWSARLVPALAVHGTILITYAFGRRLLRERAAFWGALILSLAPAFAAIGRLLILDGLLTFFTTLALFSAFEAVHGQRFRPGWLMMSALACGLGVLTKGPVALVLLVPPIWLHKRLTAHDSEPHAIRWLWSLLFLAVVLAVSLPWYVAVCVRLPEFGRHFLWEHNVMRFLQPFDHVRPVWFYLPVLLLGLLPGTLLFPSFARFLLGSRPADQQSRTPELGFLLLAGGWCVFFFSLSGSKLPTYIMPAFPPFALSLGGFLRARSWDRTRPVKIVTCGTALLLAVGHHAILPWYAHQRAPMGRPEQVYQICADRNDEVVCYPRNCDSVAFYLHRDDLRSFRSKKTLELVDDLRKRPRTIVLCTHRHTLTGLKQALPRDLHIVREAHFGMDDGCLDKVRGMMGETALGLCDIAVVERVEHGAVEEAEQQR
jgi:4-amino-4-deoxy-L-arabinose transferase-like glycosyltransferase